MALDVSYNLDSLDQFWAEVDDILAHQCPTYGDIDNVLRSYLSFSAQFREQFLTTDEELEQLALRLQRSDLFNQNTEYIRRQFVYCMLQEDDPAALCIVVAVLLFDGKSSDETFEMMQTEDAFPRLVELVLHWNEEHHLHRLLLLLMYEMARIQRLAWDDLASINDAFILSLLAIIEMVANDVSDPYHYPVIRVLLVLNEQYMVLASTQPPNTSSLTNRVLKAISTHASSYKTFGLNLILLLNRESETSLQLLILKLLYLVFGTTSTAEYFYTNDLHVLLDVILRNLLDLPVDHGDTGTAMAALRHTYLRVLHPLLENSQLRRPGQGYKRNEIVAVLRILGGGVESPMHFAPADETTVRLVERCRKVAWLEDLVTNKNEKENGHLEVAKRRLGMSDEAQQSALSVVEVASEIAKPGVTTPSLGLNRSVN